MKAVPALAKQLPKLWPLLLEEKNRQKVSAILGDLASQSPKRRLRGRIELTSTLAEEFGTTAESSLDGDAARDWVRRARNLAVRLDMPVADRRARKMHRRAIADELENLQEEMNRRLETVPPQREDVQATDAPEYTEQYLESIDCWFPATDRVPGQPEVTAFKQRARAHQAQWRTRSGLPIGSHSHGGGVSPNGSKLDPSLSPPGVNFLSDNIRAAVAHRLDNNEKGQQLKADRLHHDLLSSMPLCFNLFGDLYGDENGVQRAASEIFGVSAPGPAELRFEWSPGRHNTTSTGDGTAFDVALLLGAEEGPRQVVGIETKYHEHPVREPRPNESTRMPRYREITEEATTADGRELFKPGWEQAVLGTELQQIWRDHLLLLSMLQRGWTGGKYVLVYAANNPSFRDAGVAYGELLDDDDTSFALLTIEELLDHHLLHARSVEEAFRDRYTW